MCSSLVTYNQVYVSDIIPKSVYDKKQKSYYIDLLVCMRVEIGGETLAPPTNSMLIFAGSFGVSATVDIPNTPFTKLDMAVWTIIISRKQFEGKKLMSIG